MKIVTNLPRLLLGFSAVVLFCSCGGTDVNEPYLSVNSDPGDGAEVNQVSAELQTIGLAGAESDADQTTSGMAPFLVGDGVMDQAVGTIDPSSWGELMSGGGVLLSMVDLGEEPRRPLRLSPSVGQVESLTFEMAMNMGMSMGSEPLVMMDTPDVTFTIESELMSLGDDGLLSLRWSCTGVEVSKGVGLMAGQEELMDAEMRGLVGLSGFHTINSLGYPVSTSMSFADHLLLESPQLLEQLKSVEGILDGAGFVLPGLEVGAGASWETLREVENNGFSFLVHQVVSLTELNDSEVTFSVTTTQALGDSAPQIPNLPLGAEVEVTSLTSSGTGLITLVEGMMNSKHVQTDLDMSIEMQVTGLAPEAMHMALQNQTGLKVTTIILAE